MTNPRVQPNEAMPETIYYFAYGSNMSTARLAQRIGSVVRYGPARLPGHRLMFHKASDVDGSAKADAHRTGDSGDIVCGVVFEIDAGALSLLDRIEGRGFGYDRVAARVVTENGDLPVVTYTATAIDPRRRPWDWYVGHVLAGAREHGLPAEYIAALESVPVNRDPDSDRRRRELAIYD